MDVSKIQTGGFGGLPLKRKFESENKVRAEINRHLKKKKKT